MILAIYYSYNWLFQWDDTDKPIVPIRHATERQAAVEAQQPVLPSRRREKVPQAAEAFGRVGRQAGVGCV